MNRLLLPLFILVIALSPALRAADQPNADQFAVLCGTAKDMNLSPEGKDYELRFGRDIQGALGKALQACAQGAKMPISVNIIFVIGGNGKIEHVFAEPGNAVSLCVANKLVGEKVSRPPKPEWMQLVDINVHN